MNFHETRAHETRAPETRAPETASSEVRDHADTEAQAASATPGVERGVRLGTLASDRELLLRGLHAFDRGEDATALECLGRLAAHGRRYADVHYMLGLIHERRGDIEDALACLQESIRINPAYVEALLALASLHERRGDYDRSQGYAERASQLSRATAGELDPTTRGKLANLQAELGDALAEAGELREAIDQYRSALDRCPTFHDIRHRLGVALREAGLPAQAAHEFQQVLRIQPDLLESQIQLGLTYYSLGRTPDAVAEWDAVLVKDPSRDRARMYLRLVRGTQHGGALRNLSAGQGTSLEEPSVDFRALPARPLGPLGRTVSDPAGDPRSDRPSVSGWSKSELAGAGSGSEPAHDTSADEPAGPDRSARADESPR